MPLASTSPIALLPEAGTKIETTWFTWNSVLGCPKQYAGVNMLSTFREEQKANVVLTRLKATTTGRPISWNFGEVGVTKTHPER
jgi:hypothetical protein